MQQEFLIGIDLGTSNCAMAYVQPAHGPKAAVVDFPIVQLQRPGQTAAQPLLPSCIYLPGEHETPSATVVGEYARWQGARVPGRLVVSAKSWLSHAGVDRTAAILPWGALAETPRMSPVEASALLLRHMIDAWDREHPDAPLAAQEAVITVPASFDEAARALTVTAARRAGLEKFVLLEEPQAAFYDFTARHRDAAARDLEGVRLILVVDVGGGTSDFTLVEAGETLRRIAVGDHLMLGGDNMDAAVGRRAEERIVAGGKKLSSIQWSQLVQASRAAKEALLEAGAPERHRLSIAGDGSLLLGRTLSAELSRAEIEQIVLDGFFPRCRFDDPLQGGRRAALQELGLPYAQDPAITRQLAHFLRKHAQAGFPDAVVLNGGVFNAAGIAARLVETISSWRPGGAPVRMLEHGSLELAVARGAAYYGLVRRGMGKRIGGGTAHAFYVGLERRRGEAQQALCVVPKGQEEGEAVDLGGRSFNLTLDRPVQFPLYTSTSDRVETSGQVVAVDDDLDPLPPIHTLLKSAEAGAAQAQVHLRAVLTEIGTLELWCVADGSGERWRLEFDLRGAAQMDGRTVIESMPPRFSEACTAIQRIYGVGAGKPVPGVPVTTNVRQLWRGLEQTLGAREQWGVPVLRELWGVLYAGAGKRRRSPDHERIFFQLTGYALRPGFGYPLDEWRCEQTAGLFSQGVQFHKEKAVWIEFWIMWRRIAGGLGEDRHLEFWNYLRPQLERRVPLQGARPAGKVKGIQPEGVDEMVRLAAALEHIAPEEKQVLGDWIAQRLAAPEGAGGPWAWALGRLGARVPLYGSVHRTVQPGAAGAWLELLLDAHTRQAGDALFAIVQLARLSGDRARDVDDALRARALEALRNAQAPVSWQRMLTEAAAMETADRARAFGDTLPVGLAFIEH